MSPPGVWHLTPPCTTNDCDISLELLASELRCRWSGVREWTDGLTVTFVEEAQQYGGVNLEVRPCLELVVALVMLIVLVTVSLIVDLLSRTCSTYGLS